MTTATLQPDPRGAELPGVPTVRDQTVEVWRELGLSRLFANPGSTEIALLSGLPADLELVLALHEGSVVGLATGHALATGQPALVVLHTTAGLGNAVGALATARENRAPLVVLVGQQDRRHLAHEPFLTGRLDGLAGDYPVWQCEPARPQDVPGAVRRAWFEARDARGPALVVVPMDDWSCRGAVEAPAAAPVALTVSTAVDEAAVLPLAQLIDAAETPCLVVGAGADSPACWSALTRLAERLACPVWQEAFGARAGFPQDSPRFAGHLPAGRSGLRAALAGHDVVLVVGAPAFRQYAYEPGSFVEPGTRIVLVTDDPEQARRSPAVLVLQADPATAVERLAAATRRRRAVALARPPRPAAQRPPADAAPRAADVFRALAARLPADTVVVEETPSSRAQLLELVPARAPLAFLSAAMGGLGFALPAAVGVRLGAPHRPVVAVVGDGSAMYAVQALWTAAHYGVGVLVVVLGNGRYAIMDRLAAEAGDPDPPWPGFAELSPAAIAAGFGCPSTAVTSYGALVACLDEVVPDLARRSTPLLLDVRIAPDDIPVVRPAQEGT